MLGGRFDLAEGPLIAIGDEHRVIAEAVRPARRPDERAVDAALEALDRTVGPGDRQRADKVRVMPAVGTRGLDFVPHAHHRAVEVAVAILVLGPARRVDAGAAVKRIDAEPAVV